MTAGLLVTALPSQQSQVESVARELERFLRVSQEQAVISGKSYGLHINLEERTLDPLVYGYAETALLDELAELSADNSAGSTSEEDSVQAAEDLFMSMFDLSYKAPRWEWQRFEDMKALQFPEELDISQLANAESELSRQMAEILKPKPSLLAEMLGNEDENASVPVEPEVIMLPNGNITPLSTFTISLGEETQMVWWDEEGKIWRDKP